MPDIAANQERVQAATKPWRWHAGSRIRVLETGSLGDGRIAGVEWVIPRGVEPPAHAHSREDEAVYVFAGRVDFDVEDTNFEAGPGSWIFLPRGLKHRVTVQSREVHMLVIYSPGGIERYFEALSEPVDEATPEGGTIRYGNLFDMEYITEVARESGIQFHSGKANAKASAA